MKSSITMAELVAIYSQYDLTLSEKDAKETLDQCNEQADQVYLKYGVGEPLPTRGASEWAHHYASGLADEIQCDAMAADDFYRDAYGE